MDAVGEVVRAADERFRAGFSRPKNSANLGGPDGRTAAVSADSEFANSIKSSGEPPSCGEVSSAVLAQAPMLVQSAKRPRDDPPWSSLSACCRTYGARSAVASACSSASAETVPILPKPISPAQWHLVFDGESVSLTPSIGNWQFPCRPHYWISHNQIRWARQWTDEEVAEGRFRDTQDLDDYFTGRGAASDSVTNPMCQSDRRILHRVLRLLRLR
jgi:hypothetical protein